MQEGLIVWFTGLSGAGKSTLCKAVAEKLKSQMIYAQIVDGDEIRTGLCSDLGYTLLDRRENVRRATYLAKALAENGTVVLVAVICPLQSMRNLIKARVPRVVEVFVDAPLSECEKRDTKGLYLRARNGEIEDFTGINSPFETPAFSDLICNTDSETVSESRDKVVDLIRSKRTDCGQYHSGQAPMILCAEQNVPKKP